MSHGSTGLYSHGVMGLNSFAHEFHSRLKVPHGLNAEVAAYTSYVRVVNGQIRAGFDEKGGRTRHPENAKVVLSWDSPDDPHTTRTTRFAH